MKPPGGARASLPKRLLKFFVCYAASDYDEKTMLRIFTSIMNWHSKMIKCNIDHARTLNFCVEGSIALYMTVVAELKPIPKKCHYMFNLTTISADIVAKLATQLFSCLQCHSMHRIAIHSPTNQR